MAPSSLCESPNAKDSRRRLPFKQQIREGCTLIDVKYCLKQAKSCPRAVVMAVLTVAWPILLGGQGSTSQAGRAPAQAAQTQTVPPPSGQFFPLSQVRRGLMATAWTVFEGTKPEAMPLEILGVLRGARGPGQDMILAQLHGQKAEYTGVVDGMSGSPVYIGDKLVGSLSYRIGQFSKDPIAGITPIEQIMEVRNLPIGSSAAASDSANGSRSGIASQDLAAELNLLPLPDVSTSSVALGDGLETGSMNFQAMETPLVMSGFRPEAIQLWERKMEGTSLESVAAGGMAGSLEGDLKPSATAAATLLPGSAISAQLVRGDLEIAATCTVTYIDPKQLVACGHPILQAGPVSLPMTTADVVTTLASPLNAFKIINTGATVGAFTQDRESGVRGVLGAVAHMIPMHIVVDSPDGRRKVNVEVLDLPSLTGQAVLVVVYEALLESNESTADTSYHITGSIDLADYPPLPLDLWATAGGMLPSPMQAALATGQHFADLYSNESRRGAVRNIDLHIDAIPRRLEVALVSARLVSNNVAHAGDTVMVEATLRPWQQAERNIRIPVKLPARLDAGAVRLLVSDAGTLDRTLNQPQARNRAVDLRTVLAEDRREHAADRVYVSILAPEAQAGMDGDTLTSLPLSVANALEPVRASQEIQLNGESAELDAEAPAGGVLSGYQVLDLHVESGGGLN
jgi:hypothetical protein